MPTKLPNLDDKSYAELVEDARSSIPALCPRWTDHNPSDPGIAVIELFAWLTEMMLYRTNRLPDATYRTFLKFLNGSQWQPPAGRDLDGLIRSTIQGLRERYRAVSADDYEYLATRVWPSTEEGRALGRRLLRVRCVGERDLDAADREARAPGHVSLIVLPDEGEGDSPWLSPEASLVQSIVDFFRDRRLITTRLHVTGPRYRTVPIVAQIHLRDDAKAAEVEAAARSALVRHFDPRHGGAHGRGWPFGRDVSVSEIYALLDGIRGVDFADGVTLAGAPAASFALAAHELPRVGEGDITLTMMERRGREWARVSL